MLPAMTSHRWSEARGKHVRRWNDFEWRDGHTNRELRDCLHVEVVSRRRSSFICVDQRSVD